MGLNYSRGVSVVKRISQESLEKLRAEGSARVITKKKAKVIPKKLEEPPLKRADLSSISTAIAELKLEVLATIQKEPEQIIQVEPTPVAKTADVVDITYNNDDTTKTADIAIAYDNGESKTIHVSSITRNSSGRIQDANLSIVKGTK